MYKDIWRERLALWNKLGLWSYWVLEIVLEKLLNFPIFENSDKPCQYDLTIWFRSLFSWKIGMLLIQNFTLASGNSCQLVFSMQRFAHSGQNSVRTIDYSAGKPTHPKPLLSKPSLTFISPVLRFWTFMSQTLLSPSCFLAGQTTLKPLISESELYKHSCGCF